jgi:hypothetical protein
MKYVIIIWAVSEKLKSVVFIQVPSHSHHVLFEHIWSTGFFIEYWALWENNKTLQSVMQQVHYLSKYFQFILMQENITECQIYFTFSFHSISLLVCQPHKQIIIVQLHGNSQNIYTTECEHSTEVNTWCYENKRRGNNRRHELHNFWYSPNIYY